MSGAREFTPTRKGSHRRHSTNPELLVVSGRRRFRRHVNMLLLREPWPATALAERDSFAGEGQERGCKLGFGPHCGLHVSSGFQVQYILPVNLLYL